MRDFTKLSGVWKGMSIQDGVRIVESMTLHITGSQIEGTGIDKDGEFELVGDYDDSVQRVRITRRYTWTTEPSQEGVGIAYDYIGTWDGSFVSGQWHCRVSPRMNGPFEMWPESEEFILEAISWEQELTSAT